MNRDALARLRLSLVIEGGDRELRELLRTSSPSELVDRLDLSDERLPKRWRERWTTGDRAAETAITTAQRGGLRWVTPGHREWPDRLSDLAEAEDLNGSGGAPLGLWLRGQRRLDEALAHPVAIVGARQCTGYGADVASDMAADCADAGMTVISGAAFGIDVCAHRGAMLASGLTVAVLASGADVDYPKTHGALLSRIAEDGLIVSEQPPGAAPQKQRFLSRNRLIAALSAGVVVVEAASRSGSLNTLHWADLLSRTAMAVPGPVTSQMSTGCHAAVRSGQAVMVTSAADVVNELYGLEPGDAGARLPVAARRLLPLMCADPIGLSGLVERTRMTTREVLRGLSVLERCSLVHESAEGWKLRGDT